jgi:hypothetical protein
MSKGGGGGKGRKMTQTLCVHMNKIKILKILKMKAVLCLRLFINIRLYKVFSIRIKIFY